jgi:glycerol-3-phosphate dehydrogenase (NAD(P)+)
MVNQSLDGKQYAGYVALSGPNLAQEVVKRSPSAAVAASSDLNLARQAQLLLGSRVRFRVYAAGDVIGVEIAGALKNVLAIGAGISDGLGFGDNTKAALMTRGLAEMSALGAAAGASPQTFLGLAGVGDLMATATSKLSRNYRVGLALANEQPLETILSKLGQVAEGVGTSKAAQILSEKYSVSTPLLSTIDQVIHHGKSAADAVGELMSRPAKDEF